MNLVNLTPLQSAVTLAMDKDGHEYIVVVAKGTYVIEPDGTTKLAERQQALVHSDEYYGEPGLSSVRYESDFALRKPKVDVILNGSVYAPGGKPVTALDVSLELGPIRKRVQVYGDRVWEKSFLRGFYPSRPKPFLKMPLVYERAFGGPDMSARVESARAVEMTNLVGVGFHKEANKATEGSRLPNFEFPNNLIRRPTDRPQPAGFGFISRNWQPRLAYAGTFDQTWLDERCPFLPSDFDDRYFQGAAEDQISPHFRGGEHVTVTHASREGTFAFPLPATTIPVRLLYLSKGEDIKAVLDTLIIEPDERRCLSVYRAAKRLEGKLTNLLEVWIGDPQRARGRVVAAGSTYVIC